MKCKILCAACIVMGLMVCNSLAHADQRLSVSTSEAKVRVGAGNNFDVIWKAEKYYPFRVLKKVGDWYHVKDYEGDEGWVHQSQVGNTPTVITSNAKCSLRSEPKSDAKVLFTVGPGIPFKILKHNNNWLLLEHADGDKGWLQESVVW